MVSTFPRCDIKDKIFNYRFFKCDVTIKLKKQSAQYFMFYKCMGFANKNKARKTYSGHICFIFIIPSLNCTIRLIHSLNCKWRLIINSLICELRVIHSLNCGLLVKLRFSLNSQFKLNS